MNGELLVLYLSRDKENLSTFRYLELYSSA